MVNRTLMFLFLLRILLDYSPFRAPEAIIMNDLAACRTSYARLRLLNRLMLFPFYTAGYIQADLFT